MFDKLEIKFKEKSIFRKTTNKLISFFVIYIFAGTLILSIVKFQFWMSMIIGTVSYIIVYLYVVRSNIKNNVYGGVSKWKMVDPIYNIDEFKRIQREKDRDILIELSKQSGINTRHKVAHVIDHYRTLLPRTINGTGQFLPVLAIVLTVGVFVYDLNAEIVNEKTTFICSLILIFSIFWFSISSIANLIGNAYSKKSFYTRMEEMYTEIYINQNIKR